MVTRGLSGEGVHVAERTKWEQITWEEIVRFAGELDRGGHVSSTDARVLVRLVLRFQHQLLGGSA